MASVTERFLFLVFTVSARNAWDPNARLCPKYEENGLQIMSLAAYASEPNNSSLRRFSSHRQDALAASLPTSHHRLNRQPR